MCTMMEMEGVLFLKESCCSHAEVRKDDPSLQDVLFPVPLRPAGAEEAPMSRQERKGSGFQHFQREETPVHVLPLYSMLSSDRQQLVFAPVPEVAFTTRSVFFSHLFTELWRVCRSYNSS